MNDAPASPPSSTRDLLSKLSRYEALFELAAVINAATDIESVGDVLARKLKYVADVYSWRYVCFDGDPDAPEGAEPATVLVDGYRGRASVTRTAPSSLSSFEMGLWRDRKTRVLDRESMSETLKHLPSQLQNANLAQIWVNALVENGRTLALFLFCKRRQPFTDLDIKCLGMVSAFFHRKVHMLWERQKLRDLELAYLKQEVMLRQSERLATLGRLSAGMAHELNNPASAAVQGVQQLKGAIARLERSQFALGAANLSVAERELIRRLEDEAGERAKTPHSLDPIAQSDLEQQVEDWLERIGVADPWEHAPSLVRIGLGVAELEKMTEDLDPSLTPVVIDYCSSRDTAYTLLDEVGHGARRVTEIVEALKGYSYMDQAPVQLIDVRKGLNDTLVILSSRLQDGISVDLDYAEDLPRIQAYGSELNQVWTNLIDNAITAMAGAGSLKLKAYRKGEWVVVEVADSGPGIPLDVQGKIFDPFYTTKAPGEGTGLGLSISHSIVVEKHRGEMSVDSKPGATCFRVKLPITAGASPGDASQRTRPPTDEAISTRDEENHEA